MGVWGGVWGGGCVWGGVWGGEVWLRQLPRPTPGAIGNDGRRVRVLVE